MKKRILALILVVAIAVISMTSCDMLNGIIYGDVAEQGDVTVVIENADGSYDVYKIYLEEVENKVYAFSDAGSGQVYWLAKSFIVLGDSFVERDEYEQAKATFESVRDGYTPSGNEDDVMDNVEMRLRKLEILMTL